MKKLLLVTLFIFSLGLTLQAKDIDASLLVKKEGIAYAKESNEPFTGNAYTFFATGETKKIVPYYQGKIDGRQTEWRENKTVKTVAYLDRGNRMVSILGTILMGKNLP